MRNVFPEFFGRSGEEIQRFIVESTIVLDASVLLGLYRLSVDAREDALSTLENPLISNRLWIPYQVGKEFLENRVGVISSLGEAYEEATTLLSGAANKAVEKFGAGPRFKRSRESVQEVIDAALASLRRELDNLAAADPARVNPEHDDLFDRIEALIEDRIGVRPSDDVLRERIETFFEFRAPMQVPPGYMDANVKTGVRGAGDYLLWCEILDHAAVVTTPILFVTDDRKVDWVDRSSGQTSGPRRELVAEFSQRSPNGYHQVTLDHFLTLSRKYLNLAVGDDTISEIVEDGAAVAQADALREEREAQRRAFYDDAQASGGVEAFLRGDVSPYGRLIFSVANLPLSQAAKSMAALDLATLSGVAEQAHDRLNSSLSQVAKSMAAPDLATLSGVAQQAQLLANLPLSQAAKSMAALGRETLSSVAPPAQGLDVSSCAAELGARRLTESVGDTAGGDHGVAKSDNPNEPLE